MTVFYGYFNVSKARNYPKSTEYVSADDLNKKVVKWDKQTSVWSRLSLWLVNADNLNKKFSLFCLDDKNEDKIIEVSFLVTRVPSLVGTQR